MMIKNEYDEKGYLIVRNFIDKSALDFIAYRTLFELDNPNVANFEPAGLRNDHVDSTWTIVHPIITVSHLMMTPVVEQAINKRLTPSYYFARIYTKGSWLRPHKDRPACEHSATVHVHGDQEWAFTVCDKKGEPHDIVLQKGDAVLYHGILKHWRAPAYPGDRYFQIFYHWVESCYENKEWFYEGFKGKSPSYWLKDIEEWLDKQPQ